MIDTSQGLVTELMPEPNLAGNNYLAAIAPLSDQVKHQARPAPASSAAYLFNGNEFFIFPYKHLRGLEDLVRREPPGVLEGLHAAICQRLGRKIIAGDERAFLRAYVRQFRKRIETSCPEYFAPERFEILAA